MNKKQLAKEFAARLKMLYPDAVCALEYGGDPWRLLVMARLSAQCTDKRVNEVSKPLFAAFPDAQSMAEADACDVENIVRPCGLYRTKAASLCDISRDICEKFGGRVPSDMESLLSMNGVGRKIANLIRGDVFGLPAVVTDTHCIRICGRMGLYPESLDNPAKAERILVGLIEPAEQSDFCHRIVQFGRDCCRARSPACAGCEMSDICKHNNKKSI